MPTQRGNGSLTESAVVAGFPDCVGFRVDTSLGPIGVVEELRRHEGRISELVVRAGKQGSRLLIFPGRRHHADRSRRAMSHASLAVPPDELRSTVGAGRACRNPGRMSRQSGGGAPRRLHEPRSPRSGAVPTDARAPNLPSDAGNGPAN